MTDCARRAEADEQADLGMARIGDVRPGWRLPVTAIAVAMGLFHLYVLIIHPIEPWIFRSAHLTFAVVLTMCVVPLRRTSPRRWPVAVDLSLMIASIAVMGYVVAFNAEMIMRSGAMPTGWDVVFGTAELIVLLEATRRLSGWPIVIVVLFFFVYGLAGSYFPGPLFGKDYEYERIISFVFSPNGIYGVPLHSSAVYVFLFILFGSFLQATGADRLFINLALGLAGRFRGGPAKVAIISSSFFGTVAGSSTANVVVTGTFTIPMMIRTGVPRATAGATEAVASTGGQLVPPVMGAGAFLMAEILGIPYGKIVIAAIVPAFFYYLALFIMTDLDAGRRGLKGLGREDVPAMLRVLRDGGHLLAPLVVLVYLLVFLDYSPYRAAVWALVANLAVSVLRRSSWLNWHKVVEALVRTAGSALEIATTTASAGAIVGVLSMTGLGGRIASIVIDLSYGNLQLALFLTMVVAIVLGMGMPSVAAYAITASVAAPAIQRMGVPPLAAHMFVFYFASMSAITPPVALASFAAASLCGAGLWKVSWRAVVLGAAGFIVPYMFVNEPALLLLKEYVGDYSMVTLVGAIVSTTIGLLAVGAAITGWLAAPLVRWQRLVLMVAGVGLIKPGLWTDLLGFGLMAVALAPLIARRLGATPGSEGAPER